MSKEKRWNIFLKQATKIHGDKFDYSHAIFTKQKDKIKIICPTHGEFFQAPDKHIAKNSKGCPQCWNDMKGEVLRKADKHVLKPVMTKENFLAKLVLKYPNLIKYDLSNYNGLTKNKVLVKCSKHGWFESLPRNLLQPHTKYGCKKCGAESSRQCKINSYSTALKQFEDIYGNFYEYPIHNETIYKNKKTWIDIICPIHGLFKKTAQKHLSGQGCFPCKIEQLIKDNILVGGYSEELFINKPELKSVPATLYYLSVNDGEFFKIGISRVSVENRIKGIKCKAKGAIKTIKIVKTFDMTLYSAFILEQKLLSDNYAFRVFTNWSTELFSKDIFFKKGCNLE